MTLHTPNLKLNVPDFDQVPWDVDVDQNWLILDATVGQFFGVANFAGVWLNNEEYLVGQTVVDGIDSSMWMCLITHVTGTFPITFADERAAFPTRWIQTGASAADSARVASDMAAAAAQSASGAALHAQNAAISASAAAASAATAAAQVGLALPLTGGVMTGPITLAADPASAMQAATRQYVDSRIGGVGYLPMSGGTLTGYLILNNDPIDILGAATKKYVDNRVSTNVANYLPIAGGTITGTLHVVGESQATNTFRILQSNAYFHSPTDNSITQLVWDGGSWRLQYARTSGHLNYIRGYDNAQLWYVDPGGNSGVAGSFGSGNVIVAAGNMFTRGGTLYVGSGDRMRIQSDNASYSQIVFREDNWRLHWNWGDGTLRYYRSDGAVLFGVTGAGSGYFLGNLNADGALGVAGNINTNGSVGISGSLYAGSGANLRGGILSDYIHSQGNIDADNQVAANYIHANDWIRGWNTVFCGEGMYMQNNSGLRIFNFSPNWYWNWGVGEGSLTWIRPEGAYFGIRSDYVVINNMGPIAGVGLINISDERSKENIRPSAVGLAQINQIKPIVFQRKGKQDDEDGFSAQQLQPIMPNVVADDIGENGLKGVRIDGIVAALVNAVKELSDRLTKLEH